MRTSIPGAFWFTVLFVLSSLQVQPANPRDSLFREIILRVDTTTVRYTQLPLKHQEASLFPFTYRHENEIAELKLFPEQGVKIDLINVSASPDIAVLWFEKSTDENSFLTYFQFHRITKGNFFNLMLTLRINDSNTIYKRIELQPVVEMDAFLMSTFEEIYTGEEAVYELNASLPDNIIVRPGWTSEESYRYRFSRENGLVMLHLVAFQTGLQNFDIKFEFLKPVMDASGNFNYQYSFRTPTFNIRASRMVFLGVDKQEIVLDEENKLNGIEIQIDNHRLMQLNKTYRIEAQEEVGGALIAELFTKSNLINNRVLANVRPYNYHASRNGYLYIKDGDQARFLTNFSVIPQTVIQSVRIMREGREWTEQLRVNPNETIIVRINGQSLSKSIIAFDIAGGRVSDTISWSDSEVEFTMHIPMDNPKSRVNLLINNRPSAYSLTITEYQRPRSFDFVNISFSDQTKVFADIAGPIFYNASIRDIIIGFNRELIDEGGKLFGKQYLDIEVRILGSRGELLETFRQNNVAICPDENSLRFQYYPKNDCRNQEISLNQFLSRKTHSWDIWTRAVITIEHSSDRYTAGHYRKTVEIILQRPLRFDVDVSFPAGLLIIRPEDDKIGNLSGISMAMIAQFSFYQKDKIAVMKPYKVGAGFLALNAFNFAEGENINRDMGIVLIGSVFPTRRDSRMSFPLYIGGGYFLNQKEWFLLLGPGIRVSF